MTEIKSLIEEFFEENKNGIVHLVYPTRLDYTGGIELTRDNIQNKNKIKFMETGIYIRETLGCKQLFLPYGECVLVFIENGDVE
jgi:hypothetical protein